MRILVIDDDYPHEGNLYGDVFVHVRLKAYQQFHECIVCSRKHSSDYYYEGVHVKAVASANALLEVCATYAPQVIAVHFALRAIIDEVLVNSVIPIVVWVHGYEALKWYRRLFNLSWRHWVPWRLLRMVYANSRQLQSMRRLIMKSQRSGSIQFVFVSDWMRHVCESDVGARIERFSIIPNPVDTKLFCYEPKPKEQRFRVLTIRPFHSRKYANDLAIRAILNLSETARFSEFQFCIYGQGAMFGQLTQPLRMFRNVELHNTFLPQSTIARLHNHFGIFLCPTRQDAQGVSMCEAMSSGLVPITSWNTGIPEFVSDYQTGFLTNNPEEIVSRLLLLADDPILFGKMSQEAARSISAKAGLQHVVSTELALLEQTAGATPTGRL